MNFTARSGARTQNPKWQGNNINPSLAAQGLRQTNPIVDPGYYEDIFDLGGRIIRDKLWFYGAYSKQAVTQGQVGFVAAPNADGCWLVTCGGTTPATVHTDLPGYNVKVSYQINSTTKLIASKMYAIKHLSVNGGSPTIPLPSTRFQRQPQSAWKGEVQSAPSTKFLFNAIFGYGGYHVNYIPQPAHNTIGFPNGTDVKGNPSSRELSNALRYGPSINPEDRPQNRYELKASVSFIPERSFLGGTHQLKFGTTDDWENAGTRILENKAAGNYELQFNRGVPSQIVVYNYPFASSTNNLYSQAFYATDVMSIKRVTLNFGVRWERYHNFYPEQTREAGEFSAIFPEKTYPKQDVLTWIDTVPRVGAAWDVMGNGKTVVKGSFGLFGDTMGDLVRQRLQPERRGDQYLRVDGAVRDDRFQEQHVQQQQLRRQPGLPGEPSLADADQRDRRFELGDQPRSQAEQDLRIHGPVGTAADPERRGQRRLRLSQGRSTCTHNLQYLRPYETWVPATARDAVPGSPRQSGHDLHLPRDASRFGVQRAERRERAAGPIEHVP